LELSLNRVKGAIEYVLVLLLLISCVSSRVNHGIGLKVHAPAGAVILFDRIQGLTDKQSEMFFNLFQQKLNGCYGVSFVPHLDYDLMAKGIDPLKLGTDSSALIRLRNVVQADFLVRVSILGASSNMTFHHRDQVTGRNIYLPERVGYTQFEFISLQNPMERWHYSVKTKIKSWVHDGNVMLVAANFATEKDAVRKSFKKGVSELNKNLLGQCPK
jgi:hypothetical protein